MGLLRLFVMGAEICCLIAWQVSPDGTIRHLGESGVADGRC